MQIQNFVQSHEGQKHYQIIYVNYRPTKLERIEDYSSNKKNVILWN